MYVKNAGISIVLVFGEWGGKPDYILIKESTHAFNLSPISVLYISLILKLYHITSKHCTGLVANQIGF